MELPSSRRQSSDVRRDVVFNEKDFSQQEEPLRKVK